MFRSLRGTLLGGQTLLLLAVVGGFGAALFWQARQATLEEVDADLLGAAQVLATQVERTDSNESPSTLAIPDMYLRRFGPGPREVPYFVVWDAQGLKAFASPTAPGDIAPLPKRPPGKKPHPMHARDRGELREVILFLPDNSRVLVGRSIHRERDQLRRLLGWLTAAGAGVLSVGWLSAWLLCRRIIVPIERMANGAERISATNLAERLPVPPAKTELIRLANVLNHTFARLQSAFERQTQFTADASHELRTPLSVVLYESELALSKPRTVEEYQESLQACQRSARRMKSLVDDLLTLARVDARQLRLNLQPLDLRPLVEDAIALLRPAAEQRHITITCELPVEPVLVTADPERLPQVLCNLLSNAVTYNRDGGRVEITLEAQDDEVLLRVTDTGIGISETDLPKIFDRFFRADPARTDDGGLGLGLAISQELVRAHGGRIDVNSQLGVGSTFAIVLKKSDTARREAIAPGTQHEPRPSFE
jgi:heavy metal sensor kinase